MNTIPMSALSASDTLAFSMVALLSFSLGMILTILVMMARTGRKRVDLERDLMDEEEEEYGPNVEAGEQPNEVREPWERDPHWWKE